MNSLSTRKNDVMWQRKAYISVIGQTSGEKSHELTKKVIKRQSSSELIWVD